LEDESRCSSKAYVGVIEVAETTEGGDREEENCVLEDSVQVTVDVVLGDTGQTPGNETHRDTY